VADDLAALLAPLRARAAEVQRMRHPVAALIQSEAPASLLRLLAVSAQDSGRLLKAAEAALKAADDWDAESDRLDDLADKPGTDEEARPVLSGEAQGYSDCAAGLREAITTALTGKDPDPCRD